MKRKALGDQSCSIAKSLDIIGEWWSPLIVRNLMYGVSKFDALQAELGISRNILSDRLGVLVAGGVVEKVKYQDRPERYSYHLTEAGHELIVVLDAMQKWGDRWVTDVDEPYGITVHGEHRHRVRATLVCDECGEVAPADARLRPGPSFVHQHRADRTAG